MRLPSSLAGGVAIIRVGGGSEAEVKERKDSVDDSPHATRAAAEELNTASGPGLEGVLGRILAEVTADAAQRRGSEASGPTPPLS